VDLLHVGQDWKGELQPRVEEVLTERPSQSLRGASGEREAQMGRWRACHKGSRQKQKRKRWDWMGWGQAWLGLQEKKAEWSADLVAL
jgi:hypothetical protein